MDRDHKFRSKARVVAFVDLILTSMSLCLCLIFFIALLRVSTMEEQELLIARHGRKDSNLLEADLNGYSINKGSSVPEGTNNPGESSNIANTGLGRAGFFPSDPAFVKLMWIFLALISVMTGVQILAAIRLLNATQIGKDPVGAMKLCRFWRLVCIFFTGLLVFNFLSAFRQRAENFLEVSFLMTNILIRIVALYIVQQFVNELDVAIVTTLPIRRIHHPTSSHLPPTFAGDNMTYAYGPFPVPMPQAAPPPKYEDVVKEPYKPSGEA